MKIRFLILLMMIMILTGCLTNSVKENDLQVTMLDIPEMPVMLPYHFQRVNGGFFLTVQDTKNINININRLQYHIKKLEEIIKSERQGLDNDKR